MKYKIDVDGLLKTPFSKTNQHAFSVLSCS